MFDHENIRSKHISDSSIKIYNFDHKRSRKKKEDPHNMRALKTRRCSIRMYFRSLAHVIELIKNKFRSKISSFTVHRYPLYCRLWLWSSIFLFLSFFLCCFGLVHHLSLPLLFDIFRCSSTDVFVSLGPGDRNSSVQRITANNPNAIHEFDIPIKSVCANNGSSADLTPIPLPNGFRMPKSRKHPKWHGFTAPR